MMRLVSSASKQRVEQMDLKSQKIRNKREALEGAMGKKKKKNPA